MVVKTDPLLENDDDDSIIIAWNDKYSTGIELIDNQHKELVALTNQLYRACLSGEEALGTAFKEAMSSMVNYVRFHFGAEQDLLQRVNYPDYHEHKKQHEILVKQILDTASEFNKGKKFIANKFVRTLRDWVFGHIAVYDKSYAEYVFDQKGKGSLTDRQINGN